MEQVTAQKSCFQLWYNTYFDVNLGIVSFILDFNSLHNETSNTIANMLIENMEAKKIEDRCIGLSGDNTNTNFGGLNQRGSNNIFAHLKNHFDKDLFGVGCPAHLVNNCAHYGITALKLNVGYIVFQIHEYFKSFTVRTQELKGFWEFCQTEYKPTLMYSKTRWLTTERILKIYPALTSYFNSIDPKESSHDLIDFFKKPVNEAILLFVHSLMALFHHLILSLEIQNHSILDSLSILTELEDKILTRRVNFFLPFQVSIFLKTKT